LLKRWPALTRYTEDGDVPISNNWVENQIRPIALGRGNWLFAGSLRAGKRAAAIMSLVHSARINGHDPYAYLKDVLERRNVGALRVTALLRLFELLRIRSDRIADTDVHLHHHASGADGSAHGYTPASVRIAFTDGLHRD